MDFKPPGQRSFKWKPWIKHVDDGFLQHSQIKTEIHLLVSEFYTMPHLPAANINTEATGYYFQFCVCSILCMYIGIFSLYCIVSEIIFSYIILDKAN